MVNVVNDNWQKLSSGSARRWEPEGGIKKHNDRIHKESKIADDRNLPFTFSKPKKSMGTPTSAECPYCKKFFSINTKTVMVICSGCNKLFKV